MSQSVKYVGLDVHKDTIAVAVAEDVGKADLRERGARSANVPFRLSSPVR